MAELLKIPKFRFYSRSENYESAIELLKLEYGTTKLYEIENCTIMPITLK